MINYKCQKGEVDIEVKGTLSEISADTICLIRAVYDSLQDDSFKKMYKEDIVSGLKIAFMSTEEISEIMSTEKHKKTDKEIIQEVLKDGLDENE